MDVAAMVANCTCRHCVHPLKVDERSHARVQLHVMAPKFWMAAYLTSKWTTVNLDGRNLFVSKHSLVAAKYTSEEAHLVCGRVELWCIRSQRMKCLRRPMSYIPGVGKTQSSARQNETRVAKNVRGLTNRKETDSAGRLSPQIVFVGVRDARTDDGSRLDFLRALAGG